MTTTRGQHLIGTEIGSCVLETLIGYGGSSAVYRARSLTSQEQVAIKVFLPRATIDRQTRRSVYRRFLREAEATSQLNHPSILPIYAYGEHEGLPYIVMPYMAGGTLAAYVQRRGPLSLLEAARYLEQIGSALDYAHSQGCVHCDVKPANILLDGAGKVMLSDFGIVRTVQTKGANSSIGAYMPQGEETLMGTPDYVSPEQALGEQLDGRSDIYSLGATLYYLLTGGPPFQADSPLTLALLHVHEMPTPLSMLRADITPQIDLVLAQALAKGQDERFQSAGAFSQAFVQAVKETGIAAAVTPRVTRVKSAQTRGQTFSSLQPSRVRAMLSGLWRVTPWRVGMVAGLCALLVLSCIFANLLAGFARGMPPRLPQGHVTPDGLSASSTALLGDQQNWPISHTFFFQNGRYYIQNMTTGQVAAFYTSRQFANLRLSLQTTEIAGTQDSGDYYGFILRASADQARYYLFEVTTWQGGQYGFLRLDGSGHWVTLASGPTPGLQTHLGQSNLLSVTAQGHTFTFSINGQLVGRAVRDNSSTALVSGEVGLVVEKPGTEVAFARLSVEPTT